MKKVLILGSVVLTFLMACVVEQAQQPRVRVSRDQPAEAPAYDKGDSWVYRVKRHSVTWRSDDAIGKGGDFEIIPWGRFSKIFSVEGDKKAEVKRPSHLYGLLPTGRVQEDPSKYFDFPLFVGKKWQNMFLNGRRWDTAVNEVTGFEPVATPAGTFPAFKIERIVVDTRTDGDVWYYRFNYFYSPETRSVVKYNYMFETLVCGTYETTEIELLKHAARKTTPKADGEEKLVSLPEAPPGSVPLQGPTIKLEREKESPPPGEAEVKEQSVVAETKKTQEAIKAKEPPPVVIAKPKEASPESPASSVGGPLTLRMNIIGQRKEADGNYIEVFVNEGSVLRSHDNFQVHLETNRPAYVYILLHDSEGHASQIFPDPKIDQPGFVEGGKKVVVPGEDLWFWLDENTGTETIYVLASEKPMPDIRGLLAKMEAADEAGQKRAAQQIKERIAVMQRGVGGITKGQAVTYALSDGKKIQKVTEVVAGTSSVVRAVSFDHRGPQPLQSPEKAPVRTPLTKRGGAKC